MALSFLEQFSQGPSPLKDDAIRARLQQAILDNDPRLFRETLRGAYPELASEHRLYGVLVMTPEGMQPIMVDETGDRIGGPGHIIEKGTPIDLLNVQNNESELIATIGDQVWKASLKPG